MTEYNEKHAQWLIGQAKSGGMSRREFIGRTSALGIAMSVGTGLYNTAYAATPKKGGHMRLAMGHGATTDSLDPATLLNGLQWALSYGVASTLTDLKPDGTLAPSLATEWSSTPDAKTWTFKLRQGVEFHNGKTMTAEDVIASINYHRGEETKSNGKPLMAAVTDIKADGPNTVVFELSAGSADFPANFNEAIFGIYPSKDGSLDWASGGAGGYKIVSADPGVRYELQRNPNYWNDENAHADSIEILSIKDPTARNTALLTGEVDAIDQVDLKTVHLMERAPQISVEEGSGPLHYVFPMQMDTAPYDNADFRQAMKYAINREEMVAKILNGHGTVGNDHPIGSSYRYHASDIEQTMYDPDKAKHYMKKSGLGEVTVNLSAADAAFAGAIDASLLYKSSAEKCGININVVREPNDGYWTSVWGSKPFFASYWGGYSTEDAMFSTGYVTGAAWNETKYSDERFEKLLVEARAELNSDKRAEMYRDMQVMLRDEGGTIVPMFANAVTARNDKIAHNEQSFSRAFDGRRIMERWWMV